jgi:predicted 2-oxoglutarate/Fe(II)-dependent dioxygenase YbiX
MGPSLKRLDRRVQPKSSAEATGSKAETLHPPATEEAFGVFSIQLYSPAQCASMVRQLRNVKSWRNGRVSAADGNPRAVVVPRTRSALVLGSEKASLCRNYEHKIQDMVQALITRIWEVNLVECTGTQLIRYDPGGFYVPHQDSTENPGDPACATRYFSVLCYLNEDFEGGRTCFPGLGYSATPRSGTALIFPAYYLHAAEPIIKGRKFVLLSWLCGPLPIRWI